MMIRGKHFIIALLAYEYGQIKRQSMGGKRKLQRVLERFTLFFRVTCQLAGLARRNVTLTKTKAHYEIKCVGAASNYLLWFFLFEIAKAIRPRIEKMYLKI